VWPRCDAESSPERGYYYYYHPSPHSAGQPIVAGWAYQWLAQLGFVRESWSAPIDVVRVHPTENTNVVVAEQVKALLLSRLPREEAIPLFVFDAGYDDPVRLQQRLEGPRCQILVRLRAGVAASTPIRAGRLLRPAGHVATGASSTVQGPEHLAAALRRARLRGRQLRDGARVRLGWVAPQGPGGGARGPRQPWPHADRARDALVS
jgi:hypothetical protein